MVVEVFVFTCNNDRAIKNQYMSAIEFRPPSLKALRLLNVGPTAKSLGTFRERKPYFKRKAPN